MLLVLEICSQVMASFSSSLITPGNARSSSKDKSGKEWAEMNNYEGFAEDRRPVFFEQG